MKDKQLFTFMENGADEQMEFLDQCIESFEKITGLQYCFDKALEVIKEQYPLATEECFKGDYEIAYWNEKEAYIDRQGAWEYPGTWYPSPIGYSDGQMIKYLINKGLSNLNKG